MGLLGFVEKPFPLANTSLEANAVASLLRGIKETDGIEPRYAVTPPVSYTETVDGVPFVQNDIFVRSQDIPSVVEPLILVDHLAKLQEQVVQDLKDAGIVTEPVEVVLDEKSGAIHYPVIPLGNTRIILLPLESSLPDTTKRSEQPGTRRYSEMTTQISAHRLRRLNHHSGRNSISIGDVAKGIGQLGWIPYDNALEEDKRPL